ncbi:MAG: NAD-dependent epimerase/dehydratase family protein [Acidobacteria bacterium]|nr:NAD-dependent epimerase/dehydratase family protein [Acidobacteriota bacterium]
MTGKTVLITGGAGFVGSHTAGRLVAAGHKVRIFDSLSAQVHRSGPCHVPKDAEFTLGDVRNLERLSAAVRGVDVIFHLAAAVGVGQSMYEIADYTSTNNLGTANLLQAILDTRTTPEKIVVASSMSIYGEGKYFCRDCGELAPQPRSLEELKRKRWELACPHCGELLIPVPTREDKPLACTSIYALSKRDQEDMALLFGRTYQIPVVALRYFNIYGTRQSLSNPYTGVAAIFASRLMNGKAPVIFEDGEQMRDFVSVHDVVEANLLAMERSAADDRALNIGSGVPLTIREIADELGRALAIELPAEITGKYRAGDVRHCFADIGAARELLGYRPAVTFPCGIRELAGWLRSQSAQDDVDQAMELLSVHGLVA